VSEAHLFLGKRRLMGLMAALGLIVALCLLSISGGPDPAKGQSDSTATVAKKKKKKKKKPPVKVEIQNLYLGADLDPIIEASNAGQVPSGNPLADAAARAGAGDKFLNEVGFALKDIETNNFTVRAQTIAKQIKKDKPDIVGLQEVALLKLEIPTDGGGPPLGTPATTPLIDYSDTLLEALNKKAMSKKQCKKKGLKGDKCYRGYQQVVIQQEADVEQPGDFDNNPGPDGIGGTGPGFPPPCTGAPGTLAAAVAGFDDTGASAQDPGPGPAAANLDYNGDFNAGVPPPNCNPNTATFNPDPPGTSDCASPDLGDTNPVQLGGQANTPTCFFNGIDGDARLQMRDAIIVRKGAGVKTRNPQGGNYGHFLQIPVLGGAATVNFTRGWTSVQATVRGRSFHFLNTHLEDLENGTVREDQANELVVAGAPGAVKNTVLVGDLNSDPAIQPGPDPVNDAPESNIAFNLLVNSGYTPLQGAFNTYGHGEILNNPNDNSFTKRIDWIMTNSRSITLRSSKLLNTFANGLWQSDHAGVLSVLNIPGKK
jgi:endonuclease/exonuclease/phosphatase family metal-dependent hydrolase